MKNLEYIPIGFDESAFQKRRQWMQDQGLNWKTCSPELTGSLRGLIENHVGQVAIPLGLAGPCVIKGTYAHGTYYIPVATVEGTLVLSMTRGFSAAAQCGGIQTHHVRQTLSRSPIFAFDCLEDLTVFTQWVTEQFSTLKSIAESHTQHGKLLRIDHYQVHDNLILDFVYTTAEAAGQNMVTFCTHRVCEFIQATLGQRLSFSYLLESNLNSDKKPSTKNLLHGRGHYVVATCILSAEVCERVLSCSPKQLQRASQLMHYGSRLANIIGVNLHIANALASIYLATGQDCGCVAENAVGLTDTLYLPESNSIKFMLTMPSITIGTVGGGTILPQQQANLKLMDCVGENSAKRLAELICASALALEMSLGAAMVANEFAQAHMRFGRKRKGKKKKMMAEV